MRNLINVLADLTPSEASELQERLTNAAKESFRTHGDAAIVYELEGLASYFASLRRNTLGHGVKPATPQTRLDRDVVTHETLFGALSPSEREAFAVHMDAAQRDYRDAGGHGAMLAELILTAHDAGYATTTSSAEYQRADIKAYAATPIRTR